MKQRLFGILAMAATTLALVRCGVASDAGPAKAGVGPDGSVTRPRYNAGADGTQAPGSSSSSSSGAALAGDGGPENVPADLCPGVSRQDSNVTLALPRARATVSPTQARGVLQGDPSGQVPTAPDPASIQPAEFLNYYRIAYDPPKDVSFVAQADLSPYLATDLVLQIGVQAPAATKGPTAISVAVDTSLSMTGEGIARARAALTAIAASLEKDDELNVVTSVSGTPPRRFSIKGPSDPDVLKYVGTLSVDGGEDLGGALVRAYQAAGSTKVENALNRVVLITDGSVPASTIDLGLVDAQAKKGISLVGVGVGPALHYDGSLLARATEAGRGADVYLDRVEEAEVMLHQRFGEVMGTAATGIQVQVKLPWFLSVVSPGTSPGSESGTDEKPVGDVGSLAQTDLGPGRALVYRQTLRPCDPKALALLPETIDVSVTYVDRGGSLVTLTPASIDTATQIQPSPQIAKANAVLAFADALRARDPVRLGTALTLAATAAALLPNDTDLTDATNGIPALLAQEKKVLSP